MSTDETQLPITTAEPTRPRPLKHSTAELQLLRRRAEYEVQHAERFGREAVLNELLPLFERMDRVGARIEDALFELDRTRGALSDALARLGVTRIKIERGTPFDFMRHIVVDTQVCPELPPGCVVAERAPGYLHGDRLLVRAMVAINSPPDNASDDEEDIEGHA